MNQLSFQNVYQTSQSANFSIGERAATPDGRKWVYVKASAAMNAGDIVIAGANVSVAATVSSSADSSGRIICIYKAGAGWTPGQFEDCMGVVNGGTGIGQVFKIRGNTSTTLELYPETALTTALDGTSTLVLKPINVVTKSPVSNKIPSAIGIAQIAFAAGDYGWVLTDGDGFVTSGAVLTAGASFVPGDATTAGYATIGTTAKGPFDEQALGFCLVANAGVNQKAFVRIMIR